VGGDRDRRWVQTKRLLRQDSPPHQGIGGTTN
jgi:hypothetical protein